MSFDLAVLSAKRPLTRDEAAAAYERLAGEDDWADILEPDDRIADFVAEITARWPQIDDLPDDAVDESRWSVAFEQSPAHVVSCISWSRVDEVYPVYVETALKRGLYVYDPQEDELLEPPSAG